MTNIHGELIPLMLRAIADFVEAGYHYEDVNMVIDTSNRTIFVEDLDNERNVITEIKY